MTLLTVENRIQLAKTNGATILSYLTRADADKAAQTSSDPLDVFVADGFYRIVQRKITGDITDASVNSPTVLGQQDVPVVMDGTAQLTDRFWKLTREYGVKNGFTIVPVTTPIAETHPELGGTTCNKDNSVYIKRSACYPLWKVRCDASTTYRNSDGTYTTIDMFRILEVGSNRCWKTGPQASLPAVNIAEVSTAQPPPADELYELILSVPEQTVSISTVNNIQTTASDANVVRKYYFGSKISASELVSYLSVQLKTDARDQGWASCPNQGLWSWFELAILPNAPSSGDVVTSDKIKKGPEGRPLTWVSHRVSLDSTYTEQTGPVFAKDHELWKHISEGDVIGVLACAQFAYWKCDARSGSLNFQELFVDPNA